MSNALFGTSSQAKSKHMLEFKAGKMNLKGKMVHPDKRKGLVYVYQSDDSLMHFCWKDRSTGIVEDDLMIFPDDIETKKITQCTTGRVFLMKFKSSNKKMFFWMQENETDKDDKLWKKLNDCLNNPPQYGSSTSNSASDRAGTAGTAAGLASALGGLGSSDLQSILGQMDEQQLQMFLGGLMPVGANSPSSNRSGSSSVSSNQSRAQSTLTGSRIRSEALSVNSNNPAESSNPSTQPTTTSASAAPVAATSSTSTNGHASSGSAKTTAASASSVAENDPAIIASSRTSKLPSSDEIQLKKIQLSDLQSILGNLAPGEYNGSSAGSRLDLADVISLDVMAPILANKAVQEKLIQYLPDSDILPKNEQELKNTLTTPQFKKAMSSFSSALESGQMGPILQQFNLPEQVTVAASQGNIEAFAKAMETYAAQSKKEKNSTNGNNGNTASEETEDQMDTK